MKATPLTFKVSSLLISDELYAKSRNYLVIEFILNLRKVLQDKHLSTARKMATSTKLVSYLADAVQELTWRASGNSSSPVGRYETFLTSISASRSDIIAASLWPSTYVVTNVNGWLMSKSTGATLVREKRKKHGRRRPMLMSIQEASGSTATLVNRTSSLMTSAVQSSSSPTCSNFLTAIRCKCQ